MSELARIWNTDSLNPVKYLCSQSSVMLPFQYGCRGITQWMYSLFVCKGEKIRSWLQSCSLELQIILSISHSVTRDFSFQICVWRVWQYGSAGAWSTSMRLWAWITNTFVKSHAWRQVSKIPVLRQGDFKCSLTRRL